LVPKLKNDEHLVPNLINEERNISSNCSTLSEWKS